MGAASVRADFPRARGPGGHTYERAARVRSGAAQAGWHVATVVLLALASLWSTAADAAAAPEVVVSPVGPFLSIAEGGASDSYWLGLSEPPAAGETVTIAPAGSTQFAASPATVSFDDVSWSSLELVTLTATDDAVPEGTHFGRLDHVVTSSNTGSAWHGLAVSPLGVEIADNDPYGVVIAEDGGTTLVTENGGYTDQYNVVLDRMPTATVTVAAAGDAQVGTDLAILTFTPSDWNVPQLVRVRAPDDSVIEGTHAGTVTHVVTSDDSWYQGRAAASVSVFINDNDFAGVAISETGGATFAAEGGAGDEYQLQLTAPPASPVSVDVVPDMQAIVASPSGPLVFDASNWDVPQVVTVQPVDDPVAEGSHTSTFSHTVTSSDANFDRVSVRPVDMQITDDDTAGVLVQPSGSTDTFEAGAGDTYQLSLTSQPRGIVIVTPSPGDQLVTSPPALTFTPTSWNVPQTVTVGALDDSQVELAIHSGTVTHAVTGDDPMYVGVRVPDVVATVSDNDTAQVLVGVSAGATAVAEGGSGDDYTLRLSSQPASDVTLTLTVPGDLTATPGTVTFTPADWSTPQTIAVGAAQDLLTEGSETVQITHAAASLDRNYEGVPVPAVSVTIQDDDVPGVVLVETMGTAVTEGGAVDSYTLRLSAQPTADVTVRITVDAQTKVTPGALTFTPVNWSTPQQVTVTAEDDQVVEGSHASSIVHAVTSADATYATITVPVMNVTVADNDTAGVSLTPAGGTLAVTEGGTSATYTMVLTRQPTADVKITTDGHGQLLAQPETITFSATDWSTPRTITLKAVDDDVDESETHQARLDHKAESAHAAYNNVPVPVVAGTITDNDTRQVAVVQDGGTSVAEAGTTDTLSFILLSRPSGDVTIRLEVDKQVEVSARTVTLPAAAWSEPRKVTVTAVDDRDDEGAHASTIGLTIESGDAGYGDLKLARVDVTINDNDASRKGSLVVGEEGVTGERGEDPGAGAVKPRRPAKGPPGGRGGGSGGGGHTDQGGSGSDSDRPESAGKRDGDAGSPSPVDEAGVVSGSPTAPARKSAAKPVVRDDEEPAAGTAKKRRPGTPLWKRVANWAQDNKPIVGSAGAGMLAMAFMSLLLRGVGTAATAAATAGAGAATAGGGGQAPADPKTVAKERKLEQQAKQKEQKVAQKAVQQEAKTKQKLVQQEAKQKQKAVQQDAKAKQKTVQQDAKAKQKTVQQDAKAKQRLAKGSQKAQHGTRKK